MPFYEYECQACHKVTEALQKMSDPPLTKCPACGREKLQKLMSASAFRLSGGGWYETDFKSDGESKRNLAAADQEAKTEAKTEAKAETKPEAKATPAAAQPAAAPAATPAKKKAAAPVRTAAKSAPVRKPAAKPKAKPKGKASAKR